MDYLQFRHKLLTISILETIHPSQRITMQLIVVNCKAVTQGLLNLLI